MSRIQRLALAVCLVSLAVALVLSLAGCGGGEPLPESTYQPVRCGTPGACV